MRLIRSTPVAPCFTPYNLAELYQADEVFLSFVRLFSAVPVFVTKPNEAIIDEEMTSYGTERPVQVLLNAFTPLGTDNSYDLRYFVTRLFADPEVRSTTTKTIADAHAFKVLEAWRASAANFKPRRAIGNSSDADRYVSEAGIQSIVSLRTKWAADLIAKGEVPDIDAFPSLGIMLYSQYWRLWDRDWKVTPSDVRDVQVMAASPHVDIVVTERRQAEIFRLYDREAREFREVMRRGFGSQTGSQNQQGCR